jgi:peptidoglycan hydrolase-like protein with peptidoglycan-binding domain
VSTSRDEPDLKVSVAGDPGAVRRRRGWIVGLTALILASGGAFVVGTRVQSPRQAAAKAAPPAASWVTAAVEHRVLTQTIISRGDVVPEGSASAVVPTSVQGEPVVTGLSIAAGDEVTEGMRLIEVSARPIFALAGAVPVYRSLRSGMTGTDVAQLQSALGRLGCFDSDTPGFFGDGTKTCVSWLYERAGYEPIPASTSEAADLAAAEQAITDASAALDLARHAVSAGTIGSVVLAALLDVEAAQRALGDATSSAASALAQASADLDDARAALERARSEPSSTPAVIAAAEAEVRRRDAAVDDTKRSGDAAVAAGSAAVRLAEARLGEARNPEMTSQYIALRQAVQAHSNALAARDAIRQSAGPTVPQGEVVFVPALPARVRAVVGSLGSIDRSGDNGSATTLSAGHLAELATGQLVVSLTLRSDEVRLIRTGMHADVLDEQSSTTYSATVGNIDDRPHTGADGQLAFRAELRTDEALPAELTGANLRITVAAGSTGAATLVVPVTAISSTADGTTFVSILSSLDKDPIKVAITTGLSADGFVAIDPTKPGSLSVADRVVVGR